MTLQWCESVKSPEHIQNIEYQFIMARKIIGGMTKVRRNSSLLLKQREKVQRKLVEE